MKSVLTTVAVLIFIATPALAQSFDPDVGTGNIASPPVTNQGGAKAYAQAPVGPHAYDYGGGPYYYGGNRYYGGSRYYYQRPYRHWTEF